MALRHLGYGEPGAAQQLLGRLGHLLAMLQGTGRVIGHPPARRHVRHGQVQIGADFANVAGEGGQAGGFVGIGRVPG